MNAPIAESEKYLRKPRREELGSFTIRTSHFPPARGRANIRFPTFPHVKRPFSPGAIGSPFLATSAVRFWTHFRVAASYPTYGLGPSPSASRREAARSRRGSG